MLSFFHLLMAVLEIEEAEGKVFRKRGTRMWRIGWNCERGDSKKTGEIVEHRKAREGENRKEKVNWFRLFLPEKSLGFRSWGKL